MGKDRLGVERALIEDNYQDVIDYICDNPMFRDYYGYHISKGDIDCISFGEQCEQVERYSDDKKRAYESVGYCVNDCSGDNNGFFNVTKR